MKKRLIAVLSLSMVIATAAPAFAAGKPAKVDAQTKQTAAVTAGDSTWIAIDWLAMNADAENFQVTVVKIDDGVEFSYPDNPDYTGEYTSLWGDDLLSENEIDFTAIKVSVPYDARSHLNMQVMATYESNGSTQEKRVEILVPIVEHTGDDLQQVTSGADAKQDGGTWVNVFYAGSAPLLEDFSVTVTDPVAFTIIYPGDGTSTSLRHNDTLEDGETDDVAFRVVADQLDQGTYTLQIEATYSKGGEALSLPGELIVTVGE
jgi:hypothetical protein